MRVTGGNCTMPTIGNRHTTPLTTLSQRLVHTNPRSAASAISTAQDYRPNDRRKLQTACNTDLAHPTTHRATPAPNPHQSTLRLCHLYSAGLPPQCLVELKLRDQLCVDTRIVPQLIMPGFRSQVCRLVKLKFRDCLKQRFRSSQPRRTT